MKVYIVLGACGIYTLDHVCGVFDSKEKAVNYIRSNFKYLEYNEHDDTWIAGSIPGNGVQLWIICEEVQ